MRPGVRVLLGLAWMVLALAVRVDAQDANLLRDGGFEGSYTSRGRADLNLPVDWSIWIGESPHTEDWMNLPPVAFPHNGPDPAPHSGAHALSLDKGYATYTAAVYQQVGVTNGSNVTASAWAFIRTCKIPDGAPTCTSSPDSDALTRIGIDPNGGTNPFDSDVVWSANASPHETWQQMTVSATATGSTVTLFLYATQTWPAQINKTFWDDASLSLGGSGGVAAAQPGAPTPVPTSAEQVPYVNAQGQRSDGSVAYTVQAGDTLDSIAFAYGVTRADLLTLNNISDPRIIQIGQEIIVRAPNTPTPAPTIAGATAEATAETAAQPTSDQPPAVRDAAPAPVITAHPGQIDPASTTAAICVIFFQDNNGNRLQDANEAVLPGGQVLLTLDGQPAGTHVSDSQPDPYCFTGLAAGSYVIQAAAPSGYGLTTPDQLRAQAKAGAQIKVAFGAAQGIATTVPPTPDSSLATSDPPAANPPASNFLADKPGLIVFGVAGVVLIVGLGISSLLLLRRR